MKVVSGVEIGWLKSVAEDVDVVVPPADRVVVSRVLEDVLEPVGEGPPRLTWIMEGVV